jgi:hypothetical protein
VRSEDPKEMLFTKSVWPKNAKNNGKKVTLLGMPKSGIKNHPTVSTMK